ncbi:hypothetical protein ACFLVX_05475, partial [Chloroflexota bacterium]
GGPLAIAPFPKAPGGAGAIALAKGAPNPNAAKLFIDMYTSGEPHLTFVNNLGNGALNPQIAERAWANKLFKRA